jgi:O-antigen/teichoic acid export membrane protein
MKSNLLYSILRVVFATLFPLIVYPYVTRILGVEALGKYNFYNSIVSYLLLFSSFGISVYGIREIGKYKDNIEKKSQITVELITLNVLFSIFCYIFLIFLIFFTDYRNDALMLIILSITLFANAIGSEWFFAAIERQGYLLLRNIIVRIFSLILILTIVKTKDDLIKYVIISSLDVSAGYFFNIYFLRKEIKFISLKKLNLKKYIPLLFAIFFIEIETKYFGLGDVVLLGNIAGNKAVGFYSLGLKVFMLVTSVLKITAMTLLPRVSFYLEKGEMNKFNTLIEKTINLIFLIGLPTSIILYLWADSIVLFLGGVEFMPSSILLQKFATIIMLNVLINTIIFQILYPLNKTGTIFFVFIAGICINMLLNFLLVNKLSYYGTLYAFIVSQILIFGGLIIVEKKVFRSVIFSIDLIKSIIASLLFLIISIAAKYYMADISFIIQICICSVFYFLFLLILKEEFIFNIVTNIFNNKLYGNKKN